MAKATTASATAAEKDAEKVQAVENTTTEEKATKTVTAYYERFACNGYCISILIEDGVVTVITLGHPGVLKKNFYTFTVRQVGECDTAEAARQEYYWLKELTDAQMEFFWEYASRAVQAMEMEGEDFTFASVFRDDRERELMEEVYAVYVEHGWKANNKHIVE